MTREEVIATILEINAKLGRVPSRVELEKLANLNRHQVRKHFGTYAQALRECNLPWSHGSGKLDLAVLFREWALAEQQWDTNTLQIWPRDAWHSIWVSWRADGSRWGFYGNIQLPYARTRCGFRTMDLVLDVVVELDGSWRLKDEDELAIFAERGIVDAELERRIRAEADAIVTKLERREPPFDGSFEDWTPASDWPELVLPDGWDQACR